MHTDSQALYLIKINKIKTASFKGRSQFRIGVQVISANPLLKTGNTVMDEVQRDHFFFYQNWFIVHI